MKCFEFIQSYKRSNVMTGCKIPKFCERYRTDIGFYDPKSERVLPRSVKQRDICVYIHKNLYCVVWEKIEEIVYLLG